MLPRIAARKMLMDGTQHGAWEPYVVPLSADCVAIWTPAGTEMRWAQGTFRATYNGLHYWWPNERYLISANYLGDQLVMVYCDVVLPLPSLPLDAPERVYVDLYLDLVVRADKTWFTKDHDHFDRAEQAFPALRAERAAAEATLAQLERWAADWSGPFRYVRDSLPRTDWHQLDHDSAEMAESVRALWDGASEA
jgi:hypothetical protein